MRLQKALLALDAVARAGELCELQLAGHIKRKEQVQAEDQARMLMQLVVAVR